LKYYHTEINGAWIGAFIIVPVTGLANLRYSHTEVLCCYVTCSLFESEHVYGCWCRAFRLTVLSHWNSVLFCYVQ